MSIIYWLALLVYLALSVTGGFSQIKPKDVATIVLFCILGWHIFGLPFS